MDITADMEGVTDAGLQGRLPSDEESNCSGTRSIAKQVVKDFPQSVLSGCWEYGFQESNEKVTEACMDDEV